MKHKVLAILLPITALLVITSCLQTSKRQLPIYKPSDLNPELVDKSLQNSNDNHIVANFKLIKIFANKINFQATKFFKKLEFKVEKQYILKVEMVDTYIYDIKENEGFSFHITGLGRDDKNDLYQKQSHSTQDSTLITIGVDEIANTNKDNKSKLTNHTFLIFPCMAK